MFANSLIGLTKSDLSTQNWVALSDKRQRLFKFKNTFFFLTKYLKIIIYFDLII
jgi:hypothetical protein